MSIPAIQLSFSTYIYNSAAQSFINFWNRFFYFVSNSLLIFIYISLTIFCVWGEIIDAYAINLYQTITVDGNNKGVALVIPAVLFFSDRRALAECEIID